MIPKLFGLPIWKGKIKKRVAKKWLRHFRNTWMIGAWAQREFSTLGVGDFVNDCTGYNGRIQEINHIYRRIGKGKGAILLDIDFQTSNTGCSLCSCGVEPKLSREEVERHSIEFAKDYWMGEGGKTWLGGDTPEYRKSLAFAQKMIFHIENGFHITDEDGQILTEWRKPL